MNNPFVYIALAMLVVSAFIQADADRQLRAEIDALTAAISALQASQRGD